MLFLPLLYPNRRNRVVRDNKGHPVEVSPSTLSRSFGQSNTLLEETWCNVDDNRTAPRTFSVDSTAEIGQPVQIGFGVLIETPIYLVVLIVGAVMIFIWLQTPLNGYPIAG